MGGAGSRTYWFTLPHDIDDVGHSCFMNLNFNDVGRGWFVNFNDVGRGWLVNFHDVGQG